MQNILIIEPRFDGHRGGYVMWIVGAAIERGYKVTLATLSSTTSHPLWGPLNEIPKQNFESIVLESDSIVGGSIGTISLIAQEFRFWSLFRQFFEIKSLSSSVDIVIVPYLDYCANALAILGSPFGKAPWCGIVMRQAFHLQKMGVRSTRPQLSWVKHQLFRRLLNSRTLKAIYSIDETLIRFFSLLKQDKQKLVYLPDPAVGQIVRDNENARSVLGIKLSAIVILIFGGISERKGVKELLKAIKDTGCNENVEILLVGLQTPHIRCLLVSQEFEALNKSGRIHQIDKFVNDEEVSLAFKAADIVWLGYRNFDLMSGVLVQAGQMRLPVIATFSGLIGYMVDHYGLGVVVNIRNIIDVQEAVNLLSTNTKLRIEYGENGRKKFTPHTVNHFVETIFDVL